LGSEPVHRWVKFRAVGWRIRRGGGNHRAGAAVWRIRNDSRRAWRLPWLTVTCLPSTDAAMTALGTFEVTAATFQQAVVEKSLGTPILLDFWAEWCGPCKTLGPVLEKLAGEYRGSFLLGKVDTEREQDLAYAFQVQGIPFCVLVERGRPVDAFQGALREAEIRQFLHRNGIEPAAPATAPTTTTAQVDPMSPDGRLQRALAAVAAADAAAARAALQGFPEDDERIDRVRRIEDGLAFLEAKFDPSAGGAEGALSRARDAFRHRAYEAAMESVLEAVAADRDLRGGLPRRAMLLCFFAVGEESELLDGYRRRLATLLY
jgi:putative thioredoxin